jgi:hypothetical protein
MPSPTAADGVPSICLLNAGAYIHVAGDQFTQAANLNPSRGEVARPTASIRPAPTPPASLKPIRPYAFTLTPPPRPFPVAG